MTAVETTDVAQVLRFPLALTRTVAKEARKAVGGALEKLGLGEEEFAYDVELVVSELATNALRYGRGPAMLRVLVDATTLTIAVDDAATEAPQLQAADAGDVHGRGLHVVDRLAHAWGTTPMPFGKTVWATFTIAAPALEPAGCTCGYFDDSMAEDPPTVVFEKIAA